MKILSHLINRNDFRCERCQRFIPKPPPNNIIPSGKILRVAEISHLQFMPNESYYVGEHDSNSLCASE